MTLSTYDQDFYAWTQQQADLLRSRRYRELDLDHLRETNLEEQTFPEQCPYSWQQIADENFYPDETE